MKILTTTPKGSLEELDGAAVAWMSSEGSRTEYWPTGIQTVYFEVRDLRQVQRIDRMSTVDGLDKPMRREFCGNAIIMDGGSLELIGNSDTRSQDISVSFLDNTETINRIVSNYGDSFDPLHPVLITYYEDSGWRITIPLSSGQFQALSEAFDQKEIDTIFAGVSSFRLYTTDPYNRNENLFMAPGSFKSYAHLRQEPNFRASNDGSGRICGTFESFSVVSNDAYFTRSPYSSRTEAASLVDFHNALPEKIRGTIEREIDARFVVAKDASRIAHVHEDRVCLTRRLAFGIAHRVACYRPNQIEDFNSRLGDSLDHLEYIQGLLNPVSGARTFWGSTRNEGSLKNEAEPYRQRLTEFERECDPKSWVWIHLDVSTAIKGGGKVRDYWPVSTALLSDKCFEYLQKPWMEYPSLEFIMTDALIYQSTLEFGERLKQYRPSLWTAVVSLIGGVGVGFAVAHLLGLWLGVLAGVALYGVLEPSCKYFQTRDSANLLQEMIRVSNLFSDARISPEFVRQRLLATANKGAMWPVGAIALVEHAAKRSPVTWVN